MVMVTGAMAKRRIDANNPSSVNLSPRRVEKRNAKFCAPAQSPARRSPARCLTRPVRSETSTLLTLHNIMGQQLNKHIKRKRRASYLKRKKARAKLAAKKK